MLIEHQALERARGFSALQRAENSSIELLCNDRRRVRGFSALQRAENSSITAEWTKPAGGFPVSVLFSEPKIPQSGERGRRRGSGEEFQCSSASRKFLNKPPR